MAVQFNDIEAAHRLMADEIIRTPTLYAPRLSALTGADIAVKYENMQVTGSFKERGACNRMRQLTGDERRRGVIAMSAGNHAQAVAWHARKLGVPATIVMPEGTPHVKAENTRQFGATVIFEGATLAESQVAVERLIGAEGFVLVHPYDDDAIIAGQGTAAIEMLADAPALDTLVVPIGGGGLIAGMAIAAKAINPAIRIIGAEASLYPSFTNALCGSSLPIGGATLAEGIAVKNVGTRNLPVVRDLVDGIVLVEESAIERAVACYATLQRTMAEGAGAAGLAAMLTRPELFAGRKVGLILCGGNIDARILASVMVRQLEREERIVSFRMTTVDQPGLLGKVATRLGELGANILEVSHQRLLLDVPAKGVSLDVTVETRGPEHAAEILAALAAEGYAPRRIQRVD
ncbi:MAG: threonine ammonia-lyase [Methylocystis sp.]|nr:threonine ammonia-lyase [Methylocystis sp.]MCA3585329.1 threonine ammonia-lyase [Methylocystis sp.]MCA3587387.1 threonine ammonia-lyase [Methylocystis sp.]MCA3593336.1 threonine ammonia-lyase [Methylocystis sp.]